MGYSTDFEGRFELDRVLNDEHKNYLIKFSETRRMKRDVSKSIQRSDPVREAAGLPLGLDGQYFAGEDGFMGQGSGPDVVNYNGPPASQPGLWCQWIPSKDGKHIEWNGTEKFYSYIEWIEYIVEHFLIPWGYTLNGAVTWQGESEYDIGIILIENNIIKTSGLA